MTNTNQAFIEAYERTAAQQMTEGTLPSEPLKVAKQPLAEQLGSGEREEKQAASGPHYQPNGHHLDTSIVKQSNTRAPLSDFLSQRIAINAEMNTAEANLQANLSSHRVDSAKDLDAVPIVSTFEVTKFSWPAAAVELARSSHRSMIGLLDQVIAMQTKVLALSSARQDVGLTTTTLALAINALKSGMKIAIIDLCHDSTTTSRDSLTTSLGLSKVRSLSEASSLGMSLGEALVTSKNENVCLIAAGDNLEQRIASAAISRITANHDLVLIDAGIVGSTERSLDEWIGDTRGATLLVDLAKGNQYDAARSAAANQLELVSQQFLGVIENLV